MGSGGRFLSGREGFLTMAEIVNLRMARKAKLRAEKADQAAANRAKFSRTKSEKQLSETEAERAARQLDGARLERD